MTSPTCEDLGIPRDTGEGTGGILYPVVRGRVIHNPALHMDGLRYAAAQTRMSTDPCGSLCILPLSGALALHSAEESSFIRKRNERERDRVRCVNEGYTRLKRHLPKYARGKRLSKEDTLRGAITYIQHLQTLLADTPLPSPSPSSPPQPTYHHLRHYNLLHTTEADRLEPLIPDCKENVCPLGTVGERDVGRCASVCSGWFSASDDVTVMDTSSESDLSICTQTSDVAPGCGRQIEADSLIG
ncbi:hypothetical protein ACOMHN_001793 [Nucella lapillus]